MNVASAVDFSLRLSTAAVAVGLAALPMAAQAAFTAPLDLNPGDAYRIMFATSDSYNALSSDITTYDAIVTAVAARNADMPSMSWRAVASTVFVNAVDHVACVGACASAPIYSVNGLRIADSAAALFSTGPSDSLQTDELGAFTYGWAWTGSHKDGTAIDGDELGAADGTATYGCNAYYGPSYWTECRSFADTTSQTNLYALSGTYTATDTPEPVSAAILAAGLGVLAAARRRRSARTG